MIVFIFTLIFSLTTLKQFPTQTLTTSFGLKSLNEMDNVAALDDAQHRGWRWYDSAPYSDSSEEQSGIKGSLADSAGTLSSDQSDTTDNDWSSAASSQETKERIRATQANRICTPCPHEMMKKYTNIGIKWICGGYQRARRTFKSECMMRYRNCQDGTMFVKLYDHRCKNDTYHGRHWFYVYKA